MNNSNDFTIRSTIGKYVQSHNGVISSRCVDFESYDSDIFSVYDKFTQEEWNLMFNGVPKKEFDTWNQFYNDRVVFVAYTKTHHEPIGFICLKEKFKNYGTVAFHGGIWIRNFRTSLYLFDGLCAIIQLLIKLGYKVVATCFTQNTHAHRLQLSLGFVETDIKDGISYKALNIDKFYSNHFAKTLK
ncbi:hypothetical protein [Prevotellamassilia timonensis]|uniref:hypothetical protein n=1 Tax=Prevotellamassilia timonensis TaxID=1852370 RepID=UPI003076F607